MGISPVKTSAESRGCQFISLEVCVRLIEHRCEVDASHVVNPERCERWALLAAVVVVRGFWRGAAAVEEGAEVFVLVGVESL